MPRSSALTSVCFRGQDLKAHFSPNWYPDRGQLGPMPPQDPTLYRLYEIVGVYGYAIKSCIHEKFGDGMCVARRGS